MKKYEYKTLTMEFKSGIFKKGMPDISETLNKEGEIGWRLQQIILPEFHGGGSERIVAILEREKSD